MMAEPQKRPMMLRHSEITSNCRYAIAVGQCIDRATVCCVAFISNDQTVVGVYESLFCGCCSCAIVVSRGCCVLSFF
jgi:hypothetical protein